MASYVMFDCVAIMRSQYEIFATLQPEEIISQQKTVDKILYLVRR